MSRSNINLPVPLGRRAGLRELEAMGPAVPAAPMVAVGLTGGEVGGAQLGRSDFTRDPIDTVDEAAFMASLGMGDPLDTVDEALFIASLHRGPQPLGIGGAAGAAMEKGVATMVADGARNLQAGLTTAVALPSLLVPRPATQIQDGRVQPLGGGPQTMLPVSPTAMGGASSTLTPAQSADAARIMRGQAAVQPDGFSAWLGQIADQYGAAADAVDARTQPRLQSPLTRFTYEAVSSVPPMATGLAARLAGGPVGTATGVLATFLTEGGNTTQTIYKDLRAKGVDEETALIEAFAVGAPAGTIKAALEQGVGVETLASRVLSPAARAAGASENATRKALTAWAAGAAGEAATEPIQGTVDRMARFNTTGQGPAPFSDQAIGEMGREALIGGAVGGIVGAPVTFGGIAMNRIGQRAQSAPAARPERASDAGGVPSPATETPQTAGVSDISSPSPASATPNVAPATPDVAPDPATLARVDAILAELQSGVPIEESRLVALQDELATLTGDTEHEASKAEAATVGPDGVRAADEGGQLANGATDPATLQDVGAGVRGVVAQDGVEAGVQPGDVASEGTAPAAVRPQQARPADVMAASVTDLSGAELRARAKAMGLDDRGPISAVRRRVEAARPDSVGTQQSQPLPGRQQGSADPNQISIAAAGVPESIGTIARPDPTGGFQSPASAQSEVAARVPENRPDLERTRLGSSSQNPTPTRASSTTAASTSTGVPSPSQTTRREETGLLQSRTQSRTSQGVTPRTTSGEDTASPARASDAAAAAESQATGQASAGIRGSGVQSASPNSTPDPILSAMSRKFNADVRAVEPATPRQKQAAARLSKLGRRVTFVADPTRSFEGFATRDGVYIAADVDDAKLASVLAEELFHNVVRNNPEFREEIARAVGEMRVAKGESDYRKALTNSPLGEQSDVVKSFDADGEYRREEGVARVLYDAAAGDAEAARMLYETPGLLDKLRKILRELMDKIGVRRVAPETRAMMKMIDEIEATAKNTTVQTRSQYIASRMPSNPMGGGTVERILAREHAIEVQNALARGERPPASIVRESHEILGDTSDYPADVVRDYPFLKRMGTADTPVMFSPLPATIEVDGVQRPTTNSNGQPIARDEASVRNFWKWFAGSTATDSGGRPLVVYHGTPDGRFLKQTGVFKSQRERMGMGQGGAFWFATSRATASTYANSQRAFDYQNAEPQTIAAYIRLENPLVVDAAGQEWRQAQARGKTSDVIEQAQANGHDGATIKNVRDDYNNSKGTRATTTFTVFASGQIKSADNAGTFDPANPDIRFAPGTSRIEQRGAEQARREIDTITSEAAATLVRGPIDRAAAKLLNPAIDKIAGVTGEAYRRARDAASAKFLEKMTGLSPEEARAQVAATSEAALSNEPFAREALARVTEAKAASQFGSQVGGDFNRSFRGKGKFLAAQNADPADGPAIFEFLDGRRKIDDVPERARAFAQAARDEIEKNRKLMLDEGLMSQTTYDRYKDRYVPYLYAKYEAESHIGKRVRTAFSDRFGKPRLTDKFTILDSKGNPVSKPDGDFAFASALERDLYLDQLATQRALKILNAERVAAGRKLLTASDLTSPKKNPTLRHAAQKIMQSERAKYTTRDPVTQADYADMGRIEDPGYVVARSIMQSTHDLAMGRMFKNLLDIPNVVMQPDGDKARPGYVRMPDDPRFGPLAGKDVLARVASDINEMVEAPSLAAAMTDEFLRYWKKGKTVYNPSTHIRNIASNALAFAPLAGISPLNPANWKHYKQSLQSLARGNDQLYRDALESGALDGDEVTAELRDYAKTLLAEVEKDTSPLSAMMDRARQADTKLEQVYQAEDLVFKLAAFSKARAEGATPQEANQFVRAWFPYYDTIPSRIVGVPKTWARRVLPFVSFTYESTRIAANAMRYKPATFASIFAIPMLIHAASVAMLGLDDDDREKIEEGMRGSVFGQPVFSALMPFRDSQGRLVQLDFSNINPWASPLGFRVDNRDESRGIINNVVQQAISSNPLSSFALSVSSNRDDFMGRKIVQDDYTASETTQAWAHQIVRTFAPPLAGDLANVVIPNPQGSQASVFNPTNIPAGQREKRDPAQYVARRIGGIDLRSADPTVGDIVKRFQEANKYAERASIDDGTAVGRARRLAYNAAVNNDAGLWRDATKRLEELNAPLRSPSQVADLVDGKDPLTGIKKSDRGRFMAGLTKSERAAVERTLAEHRKAAENARRLRVSAK